MEIHHLNCGTMRPYSSRLIDENGGFFEPATLVTHCLLIDSGSELILVDTGFGKQEVKNPHVLGKLLGWTMRPDLDPSETAYEQIKTLGYDPQDVEHIFITHMDVDHAGGLSDFPQAKIHLLAEEYDTVQSLSFMESLRYFHHQWKHEPNWNPWEVEKNSWFGFDSICPLKDHPGRPTLVSLPGHSPGHAGFAIRKNGQWLFHCGDAYFDYREMKSNDPQCSLGLSFQQRLISDDDNIRLKTQNNLRSLFGKNPNKINHFCSHSLEEFNQLSDDKIN